MMPTMQIGDSKPKDIYVGESKIKEAWLGDIKLWSGGLGRIAVADYAQQLWSAASYNALTKTTMPPTIIAKGVPFMTFGTDRFVLLMANETGSGSSTEKTGGYSFDGITWYPSNINITNSNSSYYIKFLGFVNGYFMALADYGFLYYSTNGIDWATMPLNSASVFDSIVYANGNYYSGCISTGLTVKFPILGDQSSRTYITGTAVSGICTNSDGSIMVGYSIGGGFIKFNFTTNKWELASTIITTSYATFGSVFGNGKFVMASLLSRFNVYYSTDGVNWTAVALPRDIYSLSFDGNNFLAGSSSGYYMYSRDAITWTVSPGPGTSGSTIYAIAGN